ncbi:PREDICTED: FAS-associated death domain protein [Chinchilla lanigera]|uniref:FAS-associated death domain protein n=1 Tax=Chinchilla lanigera TaxID=34839 RepID=A0A8C2W782_CHILA|nr:PREDICTED: FAS-associated death domain protein [Chinchilla lanigera]
MDPFLVLLHSLSTSLSSSELTDLKFLCQGRVGKRKLERMQSGLDLFSVLLEQNDLHPQRTELLRELLTSLRRHDLLQRLDNFEAGATAGASPGEADLRAAFDVICDNVGRDWRRLARHLNVSDTKIDAIEERYPRNLPERVRESLRIWKTLEKENATVAHLVQVLRDCKMNLVADLVEEKQQARESQNESRSMSPMSWDSDAPSRNGPAQPHHSSGGPSPLGAVHQEQPSAFGAQLLPLQPHHF